MRRNPHAGHRGSGGLSLNVFTDDELSDIHLSTLEVLQRTGVWVEDDEALEVFAGGGAEVDRAARIVRIPAHVVEDAIRSAPPTITLCGRTEANDVVVESGRVGFTNFGEGIKVTDMDSGELREPTKRDVADASRLIDALPEIDVLERPVGAHDVPQDAVPLHNAEAIFANTTKHVFIGPINGQLLGKIMEMAAAVVGGADALRRRPLVSFITCPVSPLKLVRGLLRDHHGLGAQRGDGQRAQHGHGRRLLARLAGGHARHAQRRGAVGHHLGPAHHAGRSGDLRQLDHGHGPASGVGFGGQPRMRPDQRGRGSARALLPAAELGRRCVGRRQAR